MYKYLILLFFILIYILFLFYHKDLLKKTLKRFKIILILPDISNLIFTLLFLLFFLKYSGLWNFYTNPEIISKTLEERIRIFSLFFSENILNLVIFFISFAISKFIIGSGFAAMKLGILKDIIEKNKINLKKILWDNSGTYFFPVVFMRIFLFLLVIPFLIILSLIFSFLLKYTPKDSYLIWMIMALLIIFLWAGLYLSFFFRYPALLLENKKVIAAIKKSVLCLRKKTLNLTSIAVATLLISFITVFIRQLIAAILPYFSFGSQLSIILITIAAIFLQFVIGIFIMVFAELFQFMAYKEKGFIKIKP